MTAHYTHIGEEAARSAGHQPDSVIVDAEFEVLPDPVPDWAREKLESMTARNWKAILDVDGKPMSQPE